MNGDSESTQREMMKSYFVVEIPTDVIDRVTDGMGTDYDMGDSPEQAIQHLIVSGANLSSYDDVVVKRASSVCSSISDIPSVDVHLRTSKQPIGWTVVKHVVKKTRRRL